jgi:hypothetical protein
MRELMRHESIETTLKFYVGRNAVENAVTLSSPLLPAPMKTRIC